MNDAVATVAQLMELAARTAPKAAGKDFIDVKIISGKEKDALGEEMLAIGEKRRLPGFTRDGNNVLASEAVVLIGLREHPACGLDCSSCGVKKCAEFKFGAVETDFTGPNCAMRLLDMGIALGSAVKTASIHNVDNRIMYRAGVAARRLGYMKASVIMGVPLSATGKSIYYDRG